jgi:hypothetical protein
MRSTRQTFCWVFVIGLLFATVSCGQADNSVEGDDYDDSFGIASGMGDSLVPEENSAEARALLEVVNTYSLHGLIRDVDLYYNGSRHLIDHRNGVDGIRNTDDDMFLRSMAELDEIPHIGKKSMERLREFVRSQDLIDAHDIEYAEVVPTLINTKNGAAFRGEIGTRDLIRIPLQAELGDRILIWFRKGDEAQWNPKVKIVDSDTGETVSWANPWGNSDARLPVSAEDASHGFEIDRAPANYAVVLDNTSKTVDGAYEFWLECVGGPCAPSKAGVVMDGDFGQLEDDELREQMVARHERTHDYLDYYAARLIMFEDLDNDGGVVECVYTGVLVETETIPSNLEMNAEHTWPQSKGAVDGAARSDLHHLYPVSSVINSTRANHPYCNVDEVIREDGGSKYGNTDGVRCFEPRDEHKGNAARSMFYFASVYQQAIDPAQEATLREWAELDPVDAAERERNSAIEVIQGSRNSFVDDPALINRIADF